MNAHEKLNYVEFAARDLPATKLFFEKAFAWAFVDYGPEYTAFSGQGLDGGFFQARLCSTLANVVKPVFDFPGGRRFHFTEPSGNEFAVWSDQKV